MKDADQIRIELVEKSFLSVRQNKETFALTFYEKLFEAYLSGANLKGADVIMDDLKKAYLVDAIMPDGSIFQ